MNREYHVAVTGSDYAKGTKEDPFRTIQRAAKAAETGDKVIVHEASTGNGSSRNTAATATSAVLYTRQPREKRS